MLLVLPLKGTKHINLTTPLTKWVETSHPQYRGAELTQQIKRLHSIRADISKVCSSHSSHSFSLKNNILPDLIEYHACLVECINHGFPSDSRDAEVNGTADANLHFYWKNAFQEYDGNDEGQCSQKGTTHFTFERCCVLWNIAAFVTYQAAKEDWTTKDGRMNVKNHYVLAARILRHVQDLVKNEKEADLMPDMYVDSLQMCHCLCLMQGQMAVYEVLKARLADPSASTSTYTLLAKIASGVANHADMALESSQSLSLRDLKSSKIWGGHFKVMSMLFHARSEFLQSQVERRENNYGNEIARLERAVKMAREGVEFMKSEGFVKLIDGPESLGKIPSNLQSLLVNAKQRRKVIVGDNNTVYHEQVPDANRMPKIQGKDMMEFNGEKDCDLPLEFMPIGLKRPMFS